MSFVRSFVLVGAALILGASTSAQLGRPSDPAAKKAAEERAKRQFDVAAPGTKGWKKSRLSPLEIAKKTDTRIAGLRNTSWEILVFTMLPQGRSRTMGKAVALTPSKFRYEYVSFGNEKTGFVNKDEVIADGRQVTVRTDKGYTRPVAVAVSKRGPGTDLLRKWPHRANEFIFAGLGNNSRPITRLIEAASRPGSGYRVTAEDRTMLLRGQTIINHRILVQALPNTAKKVGKTDLEIVVESKGFLPVSTRSVQVFPNGLGRRQNIGFRWNLDPKQKIAANQFRLPKSASGPF